MNMEEFLIALGEQDLVARIKGCFTDHKPMPAALHELALKLYRQYLVIGGMPEAVARFVETGDFTQVRHIQDTIQMDYLDDMSKYQDNANEIKKTRLTYGTIAVQLAKKNTRFQYKLIKKGARAAEYENAIQWLVTANLVHQVYRAEQIMKPLDNYKDIDDFKIFLSDMGLLCAQKDIRPDDVFFMEEELVEFKGGMIENYVDNQLTINGLRTYFWRNEKGTKEVDFVVSLDGKLIPIEAKRGDRVTSVSLNDYIKEFKPAYSIRISQRNFGFENGIMSVPLYAVFCIK
jgi:predicted AAA+ superfamily ATPase